MMFLRGMTTILLMTTALVLPGKELKVLMIGNSFSRSVYSYLPQLVNEEKTHKLVLTSAYIGDCALQQHYENIVKAEKDPDFKPYKMSVWKSQENPAGTRKSTDFSGNVNELLKSNQYDIITIQQRSVASVDHATYEPYTTEIIKYIRKHQKNAEIVIQQTWSYHAQSRSFARWKISQKDMYTRLRNAYKTSSEKHNLRVISMGDAVEFFRKNTPKKYKSPDSGKVYKEPELPSFAGEVVGYPEWRSGRKDGKLYRYIHFDYVHLNDHGEYMQAVCWYSFLFNENAEKVAFVPESIKAEDAAFLKKCAAEAIRNYNQVK